MVKHVFISGYPGDIGGANTELWHIIRLFRRNGMEVTCIPTWKKDVKWEKRLTREGVKTHISTPDILFGVPGLAGSIVISLCNGKFLREAHRFRELGCKIVWAGCMNWLMPNEPLHYQKHGVFDRYVFQSDYQRNTLEPLLEKYGYRKERGKRIRGVYIRTSDPPFKPLKHEANTPFTVGRIARPASEKWPMDLWHTYSRICEEKISALDVIGNYGSLFPTLEELQDREIYEQCTWSNRRVVNEGRLSDVLSSERLNRSMVRARVMGVTPLIKSHLGDTPDWAEVFAPNALTLRDFYGGLHCLMQCGGTVENWPRVGLEAMAAGVPLVVPRVGGWKEMIIDGQTGCLCDDISHMICSATNLAENEDVRMDMIHAARTHLIQNLSPLEYLWEQWESLLEELT